MRMPARLVVLSTQQAITAYILLHVQVVLIPSHAESEQQNMRMWRGINLCDLRKSFTGGPESGDDNGLQIRGHWVHLLRASERRLVLSHLG